MPKELPSIEEMRAMSMLLDDAPFVVCPQCDGKGTVRRIFGRGSCTQCHGMKVVVMGPRLMKALGVSWADYLPRK